MSSAVIEVTEKKSLNREGVYTVKLSQIDNTVYVNQRTDRDPNKMMELFKSLKSGPQLNTVTCEWKADGQRLNLVAGFGRVEAFHRIALEKLVKEWNAEHQLASTDDNFLRLDLPEHRERILAAGGDWATKYQEALDSQPVNVTTIIVGEEKGEAELTNLAENVIREDLSLMDLCRAVQELVDNGVKQSLIAKKLSKQESQVSQYKKLAEFPTYLRTRFRDELPTLYKDENKLVEVAEMAEKALQEYERRLKMPKDATASISFSHARDFVGVVNKKNQQLPIGHTLNLLRILVRMDEAGILNPMSPALDYAVFKDQINATVKKAQKFGDSLPGEDVGEVSGQAPTAGDTTDDNAVSISDLAAQQQQQAVAATAAATLEATPKLMEAVGNAMQGVQSEEAAKMPQDLVDIQPGDVLDDDVSGDGLDVDPGQLADDLIGDATDEELATLEAEPGINLSHKAKSDDGMTRVTTVERNADEAVSPYNVKEAHFINGYANNYLEHIQAAETPLTDIQPYLFAAGELKSVIGLEEEYADITAKFNNFNMKFNEYFAKLEETIDKFAGKELPLTVVKSLKMLRPTHADIS